MRKPIFNITKSELERAAIVVVEHSLNGLDELREKIERDTFKREAERKYFSAEDNHYRLYRLLDSVIPRERKIVHIGTLVEIKKRKEDYAIKYDQERKKNDR